MVYTDSNNSNFKVILSDGIGGFLDEAIYASGNYPNQVKIVDVNQDGLFDVITCNSSSDDIVISFGYILMY